MGEELVTEAFQKCSVPRVTAPDDQNSQEGKATEEQMRGTGGRKGQTPGIPQFFWRKDSEGSKIRKRRGS